MNLESTREYCLTLPHATEMIQWVDHLLFKVGGKMFAIMSLEPQENVLSFKATPISSSNCRNWTASSPRPTWLVPSG